VNDVAVVMADRGGRIVLWSPGAEVAFGHLAANAVGQSLDLIVPPEFQAEHWKGFERAFETGTAQAEGQISPFPVRLASGEVAPKPGRLTLIRCPQGKVVGAVVVFAMISEISADQ
jgi:PAS domain S-box-containing protein